ncbi:hypothetical protein RDABS01_010373 [Bienertia sinuspersici]
MWVWLLSPETQWRTRRSWCPFTVQRWSWL